MYSIIPVTIVGIFGQTALVTSAAEHAIFTREGLNLASFAWPPNDVMTRIFRTKFYRTVLLEIRHITKLTKQ